MKTRLSGLADGELDERDEQILFEALRDGEDLRGCWREYQLIGDTLRGEKRLDADITGRVMAALDDEPVVLSPRLAPRHAWHRPVLAMAATLAGVGVVAWMALVQPNGQVSPQMTSVAQSQQAAAVQPVRQAAAERDMREYLAAHQAQSGFLQFRGGTENIRTVSATGKGK